MNKDQIREHFPTATDEQVKALLDINSADITHALNKQKAAQEQLDEQVKTLTETINKRDEDLKAINEQLTAAQADAGKLKDLQGALEKMRGEYEADKSAWEKQRQAQAYEFAVKTKAGEMKFSSNAAKNDFIRGAIEKAMKMDGEKILGFDDYVKGYRDADPGAFAAEDGDKKPPKIVGAGSDGSGGGRKLSLTEAMKLKNENPNMEINFENMTY